MYYRINVSFQRPEASIKAEFIATWLQVLLSSVVVGDVEVVVVDVVVVVAETSCSSLRCTPNGVWSGSVLLRPLISVSYF